MERYYDFPKLSQAVTAAIESAAEEADLELSHPLVVYAVLEAIWPSLVQMKMFGTALSTNIARFAGEAYHASLLARRVEELKAPHSLTVNGVMDDVVAALFDGEQPQIGHKEALASAIAYLTEGGVIETAEDGSLRLIVD